MKQEFKLGQTLKCKVTGISGIATQKVEYLNGCVQYAIQQKQKEGETKKPDLEYMDSQQLEFVDEGIFIKKTNTGGASPAKEIKMQ